MELINLIFRLGVVFAIFSFIWFFISFGIKLLTGGNRKKTIGEVYIFKAIQYFFLVNITFLICFNQTYSGLDTNSQLLFGAIILMMYFIGKFQNRQKKMQFVRFYSNGFPTQTESKFNAKYELLLIVFAISIFGFFFYFPEHSSSSIVVSIKNAILNIEDTPIFGFIFKVVGFFFMLSILMKLTNTFILLFTGQLFKSYPKEEDNTRERDDFDDYIEIKDELNQ